MSQPLVGEVEDSQFEISLEDKIKHKLPGYTVDILLEQGDVPGAKVELERLLFEGIHSGPAIEVTPEYFENIREKLRLREASRNIRRSA